MVSLYIMFVNPQGVSQGLSLHGKSIEAVFELVNNLIRAGCKLLSAHLLTGQDTPLPLPVDAFDGFEMEAPLKQLQQTWEELLQ